MRCKSCPSVFCIMAVYGGEFFILSARYEIKLCCAFAFYPDKARYYKLPFLMGKAASAFMLFYLG